MRSNRAPPSDYFRYPELAPINPWFVAASRKPAPTVFVGTQLCDQREAEKSRWHRKILKPNEMRFVVGSGVMNNSTVVLLTAHRSLRQNDYSSRCFRTSCASRGC
jgi:hypothetical protein